MEVYVLSRDGQIFGVYASYQKADDERQRYAADFVQDYETEIDLELLDWSIDVYDVTE